MSASCLLYPESGQAADRSGHGGRRSARPLLSMIPMMPAVAAKVVVGPARRATNRRTPEWRAKYGADDPSSDGAYGTSDQKACTCTGRCANHIGVRAPSRQSETGKLTTAKANLRMASPPPMGCQNGCAALTRSTAH